jgi:deoxyribodipyrimidine photo-lyase
MHNRGRMVVASFLTKHLLVDRRVGEAHFFRHSSTVIQPPTTVGGSGPASTGTDPQPYFRIFNPTLQGRRFDPTATTSASGSRSSVECLLPGSTRRG